MEGYRRDIITKRNELLPFFVSELVFDFQTMDSFNKIYELELKYLETQTIVHMLNDLLLYDEGA